jgi:hypothetical protein
VDVNPLPNPFLRPRSLDDWGKLMAAGPTLGVSPATLLGYCALDPRRCEVLPAGGAAFIDRAATGDPVLDAGLLVRDGPGVRAFTKLGFAWGGDWPEGKGDEVRTDLQHFEKRL